MLKLPIPSVILASLAAGALAGCDTEVAGTAQDGQETASADEQGLTGTLNRTLAGTAIPEVTVIDPDGTTLALTETAGTPVLMNLWATWCIPCLKEMPLLDELAQESAGELRVITVSMDLRGGEVVEPYFAGNDLPNLPRWMDQDEALASAFGGGPFLPLTVLYDAQGVEVFRVIGAYDWASEDARAAIAEALAEGS